ncbi:MAG: hypothetical protein N3E44_06405 [Candidatus Bathyarchaeota archaeon]|nr:hypothetical protein [Candidatus Bathyarchaeota archaeon]
MSVRLDWRERRRMLKLSFPTNLDSYMATYWIIYGAVTRMANGAEESGCRIGLTP